MKILAPAKINLMLHITGRREDGYHFLESLIGHTDIGDELVIRPANSWRLEITGPYGADLPHGRDNLITRAALLMAETCQQPANVQITLHKNLPISSGIGGGSSNAAAIMLALLELWGMQLPAAELDRLALMLGADIPVCLRRHSAWLTGIGDHIQPSPNILADYGILLINPGQSIPTPQVFNLFGQQPGHHFRPTTFPEWDGLLPWLHQQHNDLTRAAVSLCPEIAHILDWLRQQPETLLSRMSGSGATCFALAPIDQIGALEARTHMKWPNYWVKRGKFYSDDIYLNRVAINKKLD